jgi:pyruvate dehydrogenase (quinone)
VIKNDYLGQIKWEQMVFLGNPEYGVELQPIDFVKVAEACGGTGITIDDPADCARGVAEALARPGPVLIEAIVDPLEAPMPATVTREQAAHFAESILRGQPKGLEIARHALGDKIREMV